MQHLFWGTLKDLKSKNFCGQWVGKHSVKEKWMGYFVAGHLRALNTLMCFRCLREETAQWCFFKLLDHMSWFEFSQQQRQRLGPKYSFFGNWFQWSEMEWGESGREKTKSSKRVLMGWYNCEHSELNIAGETLRKHIKYTSKLYIFESGPGLHCPLGGGCSLGVQCPAPHGLHLQAGRATSTALGKAPRQQSKDIL